MKTDQGLGETDYEKALRKLRSRYGRSTWNDAGYFDVPGATMRELVSAGHAEARKRSPSSPAEYRGR